MRVQHELTLAFTKLVEGFRGSAQQRLEQAFQILDRKSYLLHGFASLILYTI